MTDIQLNCYWYTAILGIILLCQLILNWIVRKWTVGYFNCVSKKCVYKSYI